MVSGFDIPPLEALRKQPQRRRRGGTKPRDHLAWQRSPKLALAEPVFAIPQRTGESPAAALLCREKRDRPVPRMSMEAFMNRERVKSRNVVHIIRAFAIAYRTSVSFAAQKEKTAGRWGLNRPHYEYLYPDKKTFVSLASRYKPKAPLEKSSYLSKPLP